MKSRLFIMGALLCVLMPAAGFAQTADEAQEEDVEGELEALEEELYDEDDEDPDGEDQREDDQPSQAVSAVQSMNPDISLILTTAGAWSSGEADLRGGHDPQDTGFNLQGLELAIGADVDPYFRFDSAILFSLFGVEVEEAYATTLALPWQLQARAGQFKTQFGRLNPTHLHSWRFVDQPLVNAKFFGGESLRGMGAELSQIVLWMPGTFRWYAAAQNISGEATGRSFVPASDDIDTLADLTVTLRAEEFVELSRDWDLLAGASWANGRNKTGRGNRSEIYGLDTYLKWRSRTAGGLQEVGWQTEAMVRRRQIPGGVLEDFGLSSWLAWRPGRHWETALRYEYVSGVDPEGEDSSLFGGSIFSDAGPSGVVDPLDPEWTQARQRGALQLSYLPSHFSRLRLQYSLDHLPYRQGGLDELVHTIFLQAEVVAGAHGTHAY
ncbi:MAG: zinc-regulated TonB-dependent outer membrane receptor [Persicimonas sp.]